MTDKNPPDLNACRFITGFIAKKQKKPTFIMVYAVLAMIAWKYFTVPVDLQSINGTTLGVNTTWD
ncbi:MAG: hypothetical protein FWD31_05725, partial [Planctomycetaceae bacterium]|nr:hypothetical protein [Planctomycetaceae bacterium]